MPKTTARRALAFATLDQVMPDVDRLLSDAGRTNVGNWTLAQVCNHLTTAVTGSMDAVGARKAPWLLRKLIGPVILKRLLKSGTMPEGVKVPHARLIPRPALDDRAEAEALRAALRLFAAHSEPMRDHPFLGPLTRAEWDRLHCIHCAHHLSFIVPGAGS